MVGGVFRRGLEWGLRFRCLGARRLGGRGGRYSLDRRGGRVVRGSRALETRGLGEAWVGRGREFRARGLGIRGLGRCGGCRGGWW